MEKYIQCKPRELEQVHGGAELRRWWKKAHDERKIMSDKIAVRDAEHVTTGGKITNVRRRGYHITFKKSGDSSVQKFLDYAKLYHKDQHIEGFIFHRERDRMESSIHGSRNVGGVMIILDASS